MISRWKLASMGALLALTACDHAADRALNVPPLRRYAERLVATSGSAAKVERCDMFGATRRGYCLLSGTTAALGDFERGLALHAVTPGIVYGSDACLTLAGFGAFDAGALVAGASVVEWKATAALPPNTDNVRFVRGYRGPAGACVELEYPYG